MDQVEPDCHEKPLGQNDICDFNPDFAVICSFIEHFGEKIDIELDIERLRISIEDRDDLDEGLIDIHVKLIKKIRRYFVRDQWEKALIRFAAEYSYEDAYEIERFGYLKTRPSVKLELLRRLLDAQFEYDQKFKAVINSIEANELRLRPTGRDLCGNTYWHSTDKEGNLRIFIEEPLDYKSWKAVCKTSNELGQLIEKLKSTKDDKLKGEPKSEPYNPLPEIFPELFVTEKDSILNQREAKTSSCKSSRKGRGRSRNQAKKSSLPFLKEEEEDNVDYNFLQAKHSHNSKDEIHPNHSLPSTLTESASSPDKGSVESQVKHTVESLISKVVSSIDYFLFRPLTKNFTDAVKHEFIDQAEKQPVVNQIVPAKPAPKKRQKREKPTVEGLPRRSSSRIQQLQQKKEQEELQKIVELSKKAEDPTQEASIHDCDSKIRTNGSKHSGGSKSTNHRKADKQRWRETKGKKKQSWDKDDSDVSSTSSLTESEDRSDEDLSFNMPNGEDDDEFACEEEDTNLEPVIIKRARTARESLVPKDDGDLEARLALGEDKPCGRCDKSNDPECILLCDMCDDGYHLACCIPPLMIVPDGDWFCPPCEHKTLIIKLDEINANIIRILEAKERERMKRERFRAAAAAKRQAAREERIKDEIVPEKRQRDPLYELGESIAVQELDEEIRYEEQLRLPKERSVPSRRKGSLKDRTKNNRRKYRDDDDFIERPRRTYSKRQLDTDEETDDEYEDETDDGTNDETDFEIDDKESAHSTSEESFESDRPKTRRARACVSYKFKEYDDLIRSAIQGDSSEDEILATQDSEPEERNYGRGKDMATIEALAYQQENGLLEQAATDATSAPQIVKTHSRKKGRGLNDLDAESEIDDATSDESFQASSVTAAEEDDDDVTDFDTEGESSFDEIVLATKHSKRSTSFKKNKLKKRRLYLDSDSSEYETRTRRAATKRISYKESTDDEDQEEPKEGTLAPSIMTTTETTHPMPFYSEDEVRPPPTSPDRQRTW